ncbi:MAG: hypothetical protein JXR34_02315 [Bacteroidales bacterium]|nr:hypothetical protein [Bacteroidales bacterium]
MKKFKSILFILLAIVIYSCDNEVDINQPGQEITVVYGLLNQSETRHYVKITKAFLIDGNVYAGASDSDKSEYSPNDLEVYLDEFTPTSFYRRIILDTFLVENKDSGVFYFPNQIVWATPENTVLNLNNTYNLTILNKNSGEETKASATLVGDISIAKPVEYQKYISLTGNLPLEIEWRSAKNGKLYQVVLRFFYTERSSSGIMSSKFVDMPLSLHRSNTTNGGENITDEFYGSSFYQNLKAKIPNPDNGMVRYPDSVHYIFWAADEIFTIYMDVNKPTTGVVTEKPAFTNIENGLGIFAGRYSKTRSLLGLTPLSIDTLIDGQYTHHLGFQNYPNP